MRTGCTARRRQHTDKRQKGTAKGEKGGASRLTNGITDNPSLKHWVEKAAGLTDAPSSDRNMIRLVRPLSSVEIPKWNKRQWRLDSRWHITLNSPII